MINEKLNISNQDVESLCDMMEKLAFSLMPQSKAGR